MDLMHIGSQCSHPSCDEVDFLPVLCRCDKYFCRHHIISDLHSCPTNLNPALGNSATPVRKLHRCAIDICRKPSLCGFNTNNSNPQATCSQCRKSFCADHRHPESHSCQAIDAPRSQKSDSARVLLASNFPTIAKKAVPQRTVKIPTNPVKLARYRKVELMKMRHQAAPGNPADSPHTPQDQRLHLRLQIDEQTEKVFWFRQGTVTGKVLDCLASHIGMSPSVSPPLQLLKVCPEQEGKYVLRNDQAIIDNIEEGELLLVDHENNPL